MSNEPGTFCWIELTTPDRRTSLHYYSSLFGWTAMEIPIAENDVYVMLQKNGKTAAAMYENKAVPTNWQSYVAVTSVDDSAKKARDLGANLIAEPMDVNDAGRMAVVQDPQGATFALWQAGRTKGIEVRDEPGGLCWNELMTSDVEAARKFYGALFSWNLKVSPEYSEIHVNERPIGGLMQISPEMHGMPSHWQPYFAVDDCDATLNQAKSLGTTESFGPVDIPKVGRFAILKDPHGATFAIIRLAPRQA